MGTRDSQDRILFTADEAAKFLNKSLATVYRLIKKGALEKVKLQGNRTWFITMDSCEAYAVASSFTLPEMAARLLKLERQVGFLLTQANSVQTGHQPVPSSHGLDYSSLQEQMKKRHPELFKKN